MRMGHPALDWAQALFKNTFVDAFFGVYEIKLRLCKNIFYDGQGDLAFALETTSRRLQTTYTGQRASNV
jgi:hypothetical protein